MKLLVLGATGLLGHTVFETLNQSKDFDVIGTVRSEDQKSAFNISVQAQLLGGIDVANETILAEIFEKVRPDQVINCIGYTKHQPDDSTAYMALNSVLPHRLLDLSNQFNSRLIHISTDCVFSGKRGNYQESDITDADDLYGKSKILGEILISVGKQIYKPRRKKLEKFYEYIFSSTKIKPRNFYRCMLKQVNDQQILIFPDNFQ